MKQRLLQILSPVRLRQRGQSALRGGLSGLFATAVAALLLVVWKLSGVALPSTGWIVAVLAAGPLVGTLWGALSAHPWMRAASAVDHRYSLKDRTVTTLSFLSHPSPSPLHQLQIDDTFERLVDVDARHVVPFHWPRWARWSIGSALVALALLAWPLASTPVSANIERPAGIEDAAAAIAAELEQLKEIAEEEQLEELETVVEQLEEQLKELDQPETEVRDALATISEMQAKLAEQMKQFNTAAIDAQMQALAEAMSSAEAFQAAAGELKEGDYDKAAEKLEQLENVELDRKESRSLAERLSQVASSMKKAGMSQLSESVDELSSGCKDCDSDRMASSSRELAGQCRSQSLRKSMSQLLAQKLSRLSECKSMCQGGQCKQCGGNCRSGQCQSNKNSLAKGPGSKSQKASKNWGQASHGNLDGEATKIDATRAQEQLTGPMGEGSSEFETTASPEGEETARRGYKEAYTKYRKLSEAVLETEPIPLGQRQVIRNYFEMIRPDRTAETQPATQGETATDTQ